MMVKTSLCFYSYIVFSTTFSPSRIQEEAPPVDLDLKPRATLKRPREALGPAPGFHEPKVAATVLAARSLSPPGRLVGNDTKLQPAMKSDRSPLEGHTDSAFGLFMGVPPHLPISVSDNNVMYAGPAAGARVAQHHSTQNNTAVDLEAATRHDDGRMHPPGNRPMVFPSFESARRQAYATALAAPSFMPMNSGFPAGVNNGLPPASPQTRASPRHQFQSLPLYHQLFGTLEHSNIEGNSFMGAPSTAHGIPPGLSPVQLEAALFQQQSIEADGRAKRPNAGDVRETR